MSMHDFVEKPVEEPTDEIEKNVRSEMPSFGHRLIGALMVLSAFCPEPASLNINKDYNVDDSNRNEIVKSIDEIGPKEDKPELFEKDGKTYRVRVFMERDSLSELDDMKMTSKTQMFF